MGSRSFRSFSDPETVTDGGQAQYECDECGLSFETPQAFAGHSKVDHSDPWTDPEVLRRLYVEQGRTSDEVGEILGCSFKTVTNWLEKHGIDRRKAAEQPGEYADEDALREMYLDGEMSIHAIADHFGCSHSTIDYWLKEFDIPKREKHEKMVKRLYRIPPTFTTTRRGYEVWRGGTKDGSWGVQVHRLLAVAEYGLEAIDGKDVHHKNGIPWDNRPENIEPVTRAEHVAAHQESDYPWRPKYE